MVVCATCELAAMGAEAIIAPMPGVEVPARLVLPGPTAGGDGPVPTGEVLGHRPDVVILVSGLRGGHPWVTWLAGALIAARPGLPALVVLDRARPGWLPELAEIGVAGIADLAATPDELRAAVRAVATGRDWVSPGVAEVLAAQLAREDEGAVPLALSPREQDVLAQLALGHHNTRIAADLGISANTVANHVKAICTKLGATSRLHAVSLAVRAGLLDL